VSEGNVWLSVVVDERGLLYTGLELRFLPTRVATSELPSFADLEVSL
jgi:hypothetical protein